MLWITYVPSIKIRYKKRGQLEWKWITKRDAKTQGYNTTESGFKYLELGVNVQYMLPMAVNEEATVEQFVKRIPDSTTVQASFQSGARRGQ